MTKFLSKNGFHHPDDKNKTSHSKREALPRQKEDVPGACVTKSFINGIISYEAL